MRINLVAGSCLLLAGALTHAQDAPPFPGFATHDVDPASGNVPGIAVADINSDGKLDIVAAADNQVVWYQNPDWEKHLIMEQLVGLNVALALQDITGDGVPEIALAADWQFNNTQSGGVLFLLKSGADVTQPWLAIPLMNQAIPTIHRLRWTDFEGDGRHELVVAPLKGVNTTEPAHQEAGVKLFLLRPGEDPLTLPWTEEVIDESLHVLHNVWPLPYEKDSKGALLLAASFEGISAFLRRPDGTWEKRLLAEGNPEELPNSGAGEIKARVLGVPMMATVEPWHGTKIVVYTPNGSNGEWHRHVIDDQYAGGHAVYWADFDGDGEDELLAGHREPAGPDATVGLHIFDLQYNAETKELKVFKHALDVGGMATEDAVAADINGDGRPDVVASGRATGNIRYYENLGIAVPEPSPEPAPVVEEPQQP